MAIDADGSPRAYAPPESGLKGEDYLANAGSSGNWWGVVTDTGKKDGAPVVQRGGAPAPGFYVSATSLVDPTRGRTDPLRYVDSSRVPFLALGKDILASMGGALGDLAWVVNTRSGLSSPAIVADIAPKGHHGEGSMALAGALGINQSPRNGGTDAEIVAYVVFPGSARGWPVDFLDDARHRFDAWGGWQRLGSVLGINASTFEEHSFPIHMLPRPWMWVVGFVLFVAAGVAIAAAAQVL